MVRTQIQLDDEQYERLKRLAADRSVSLAQLVRDGVSVILSQEERQQRWQRLLGALGSFTDEQGTTDVAERHDEYLDDAFSHD